MLGEIDTRARRLGIVAILALTLVSESAAAEDVARLVNGYWFDGSNFTAREFYVIDGLLREEYDGAHERVVDLGGTYVVPAYGNAHTHGIGNDDFSRESDHFLGRGVFYVANPNSVGSRTAAARQKARAKETVDARFANGGLTSPGGHPIQIFEEGPGAHGMDGDAYFAIGDLAQLERRWPDILAGKPDFLKVYLERSEHHASRKNDPAYYGKRGLDPDLVRPIVDRTHAAGLRVSAHVTSRHDFRVAVEAGVDEIAHLPLEELGRGDAQLVATHKTVVVTTALSHRPTDDVEDLDALHRANLKLLRDASVPLVLGTDSHATVVDELQKLASLDVFEPEELLRMLVIDTPRWIFPERNLGLSPGSEANFVCLAANPLRDLGALAKVTMAFKAGRALELTAGAEKRGVGQHLVHFIMSRGTEAAFVEYRRLQSEEPDDWDFSEAQLEALGRALMQHGKTAEAIGVYRFSCEQFPESPTAWESLGRAHVENGDEQEADDAQARARDLRAP